jgi:hypothetical protein
MKKMSVLSVTCLLLLTSDLCAQTWMQSLMTRWREWLQSRPVSEPDIIKREIHNGVLVRLSVESGVAKEGSDTILWLISLDKLPFDYDKFTKDMQEWLGKKLDVLQQQNARAQLIRQSNKAFIITVDSVIFGHIGEPVCAQKLLKIPKDADLAKLEVRTELFSKISRMLPQKFFKKS